MQGDIKAKLEELYPTGEDMLRDRKEYTSWKALAKAIKVSEHNLLDHRRRLGMPREPKKGIIATNFSNKTAKEIDESIKAMGDGEIKSTNVYNLYRICNEECFEKDPTGYRGLKFIETKQGKTWRAIHNPSIYSEGARA